MLGDPFSALCRPQTAPGIARQSGGTHSVPPSAAYAPELEEGVGGGLLSPVRRARPCVEGPGVIGAVHVERLAIRRGERLLFSGLDLMVSAGEAVALTGRNGAGKTSLLRAIAG